ncbi:hypothetical protein UPYG_G00301390 [Umbra pygmaea]|uniref:Ig-like domain-containing protein n=1 Tax=Umbra pygmaea TaxID=75934 RepID=A0ABD0W822_UMBPY
MNRSSLWSSGGYCCEWLWRQRKAEDVKSSEGTMAESRVHNQFKLITDEPIHGFDGDDVILPCHLSPETSAVTMTIRWFKETECIYLYNNGQVTERTGYEDRLSLITQKLERGNVSLRMKNIKKTDVGFYICQVNNGEQKEEDVVWLWTGQRGYRRNYLQDETQEQKLQREKSAVELVGLKPIILVLQAPWT